jgi:hypothetical protein
MPAAVTASERLRPTSPVLAMSSFGLQLPPLLIAKRRSLLIASV